MSLETPEKIRMLQKKLYSKAKQEPDYRFYLLYDKIYRDDILRHGWALAKDNGGAREWMGRALRRSRRQGWKSG